MDDLLVIKGLKTYYYSQSQVTPAVDGFDLRLGKGETIGIVGESGCGKSTVARSILGLYDRSYTRIEDGEILFHGQDLTKLRAKDLNRIRGSRISVIFQNPLTSLNPVFSIGNQIAEVLRVHTDMDKQQIYDRCIQLLKMVEIPSPEERMMDYPHQLSGGMQQRVMIAIALACNTEIIIADEPTTALDVTIQAQILDLIRHLNEEFKTSMILITHNMGVVAEMCQRVLVMYGGVVVEEAGVNELFGNPLHPYTQGLLAAIPSVDEDKDELYTIRGTVPKFRLPIKSCRFADRCSKVFDRCWGSEPLLYNDTNNRKVRCFLYAGEGKLGE